MLRVFLFLSARNFPLLSARVERVFAHESDDTMRALNSSTNIFFPIVVVRFFHRHIDEFVGRSRMKGLPY